jgi:hypothetical protein
VEVLSKVSAEVPEVAEEEEAVDEDAVVVLVVVERKLMALRIGFQSLN